MLRSLVKPGVSQRTDFPLRQSSMALLVIDIQRELTTTDGDGDDYKNAIGFPRMVANTKLLVEAVRSGREREGGCGRGCEIVFTYLEALTDDSRDVSLDYKLSSGLSGLPGPGRATFLPGICPARGRDISLPKTSCSVFQSTNLDYILRNLNVEQLVVCGQLTDQCVESAVRDAADLGYLVTVVEDACGAKSEESHRRGLLGMRGFARMMRTDQVLTELSGDGGALTGVASGGEHPPSKRQGTVGHGSSEDAHAGERAIPLQKPSEYIVDKDRGCHSAILRSLRAAGVTFLRYAVVDAFNTIRCKAVPLATAVASLRDRTRMDAGKDSPLDSPVSIAEVCFAGLPPCADSLVPASKLSAANVLTLRPDLSSLRVLPYAPCTAMIMCTAHNQRTGELSPLCTRGLLKRLIDGAKDGMGVEFSVGAEIEFQLFWSETKAGVPQAVDATTFAASVTLNEQEDFINDLHDKLCGQDIPTELIHAESAPGQLEVVIGYSSDVLQLADDVLLARETISSCAKKHGMKALFLPKTSETTAGSGLHLHFSFRDVETWSNAFSDPSQPTGISVRGGSFIEGILAHLPSLLSFTIPTSNSFRRIGPGCWTGSSVGWSLEDKEVPVRVCVDLLTREVTNVEYKLSDAMANIYLALAMVLAAGLDGMKSGRPLRPMATDGTSEPLPNSLRESLDLLRQDELLISVLGLELSTAYLAVREWELGHESTLEEEVMCAFAKA